MRVFDYLKKLTKKEPTYKKISTIKSENNDNYKELCKQSMEHLKSDKIDSYRCDLFNMARILEKEGSLKDALKQYLYVFYLDTTGISSFEALQMGLTPRPFIAPGVVNRIRIVKNKLKLSDDDFKCLYFDCPLESILQNAIFSYSESYDLLLKCLDGKIDETDTIIKKALKRYKH